MNSRTHSRSFVVTVRVCIDSSDVVLEVANAGIQAIAWSPLGSHLLTWQRPQKDSELGNLIVWNATTGAEVARFNQKSYSRDVRHSVSLMHEREDHMNHETNCSHSSDATASHRAGRRSSGRQMRRSAAARARTASCSTAARTWAPGRSARSTCRCVWLCLLLSCSCTTFSLTITHYPHYVEHDEL